MVPTLKKREREKAFFKKKLFIFIFYSCNISRTSGEYSYISKKCSKHQNINDGSIFMLWAVITIILCENCPNERIGKKTTHYQKASVSIKHYFLKKRKLLKIALQFKFKFKMQEKPHNLLIHFEMHFFHDVGPCNHTNLLQCLKIKSQLNFAELLVKSFKLEQTLIWSFPSPEI